MIYLREGASSTPSRRPSLSKGARPRGGNTPANGVSVDYGPVPRSAPQLPHCFIASAGITTGLMSPLSSILLSAAPRFKVLRIEQEITRYGAADRRARLLVGLVAWHTGDCVHTDQEGDDGHDQSDGRIAVLVSGEHPVKQLAHRFAPSLQR